MGKRIFYSVITVLLLVPLVMWIAWVLTPNTKLVAAVVDKTVLTSQGQKHISIYWVLNNERFTKTTTKAYDISKDYYGFFPLEDENYKIKGLERFTSNQLNQLSEDADLVYFADTYGIYNNEWFSSHKVNDGSGMLYGGLSTNDIALLGLMKEKHKLIIAEFNTIGSPTTFENRVLFEDLFKMKWTGWTARYFDNLNIKLNKDIPVWLINNYKRSHNNQWPFEKAGIAFVNDKNEVVILEEDRHLTDPMPHILSNEYSRKNLSLPSKIKYPFWFDVVVPDKNINESISTFQISCNDQGLKELKKYGIPSEFPAVTKHTGKDYSFYYFSGDFSDNPINLTSSYFKGIGFFQGFFYNEQVSLERTSFFWKFYKPLLTNILKDYQIKRSGL